MTLLHMCMAVLVAAAWGTNFVAAKIGMSHFPPYFLTGVRFFLTALILIPFVRRPTNTQLKHIALVSFVLVVLHFAGLYAALHHGLDIASCAVIAQMGVPFSCLLGVLFFKDRIGAWRTSGLLISFCGVFIIAGSPHVLASPLGFGIALTAAFFWAVANLLLKKLEGVGSFQCIGWMAVFAIPMLLVVSLIVEGPQWHTLESVPTPVIWAITYTVLGSTFVGYGLWYYLLKKYPISQVAPFSLMAPIFSVGMGQFFFDEPMTWEIWLGGTLTLVGVAVIVMRRPKLVSFGKSA